MKFTKLKKKSVYACTVCMPKWSADFKKVGRSSTMLVNINKSFVFSGLTASEADDLQR